MNELDLLWMSALIFAPTLFALVILFIPKGQEELMRWVALLGTAVSLAISLIALIGYLELPGVIVPGDRAGLEQRVTDARTAQAVTVDPTTRLAKGGNPPDAADWTARAPWIKQFNIEYFLGIDGISLPLIVLTTALCFLAMIASWKIEKYVKGYLMLFLLLETGMVGCFMALDFFLFYIFWEVMLLPMYFLIGVWGGPRREYAAIKFFLYTLLGSVFILIAMLAFYFTDVRDFVSQDAAMSEQAMALAAKDGKSPDEARAALPQYILRVVPQEIHTFDMITLAKAGRAAALNISGQSDKAVELSGTKDKAGAAKRFESQSFFRSSK